jgi:hypothetical protein
MNIQFVVFLLIEQELSFRNMRVTCGFNSIQKTHKGSNPLSYLFREFLATICATHSAEIHMKKGCIPQ